MRSPFYFLLLISAFLCDPRTIWAQEKTPSGFFYPMGTSNLGSSAGFLTNSCNGNDDYLDEEYHIGRDIPAGVGDLVYAISDGVVVKRSPKTGTDAGWGLGNIALVIKHKLSNNKEFLAVYGHIQSDFDAGDIVRAGDPFGMVGPYPLGSHLHFGIHPELSFRYPNLGKMPCSKYPDPNGFVDPIDWVVSQVPGTNDLWTEKASFPSIGQELTRREPLSFSIGNSGYLGVTNFIGVTTPGEFWRYKPSTNEWVRKADHPGIQFQSPHFVANGRAYVVSANQVWEYNPGSNQWKRKADIPGADKRAGFGFAVGNKGYIGGGFYNGQAFWEYDVVRDRWTQKSNHPVLNYASLSSDIEGITFSIGNKAYVTGTNMNFWEYNPSTDAWTQKAYVNAVYGQAFSIESRGYVFNTFRELFEYDPLLNQWTPKASYLGRKVCYPGGFSIDSKGYIGTGGLFENNTCSLTIINDFWEYTPFTIK